MTRIAAVLAVLACASCGLSKEKQKDRDLHLDYGQFYFENGRFEQSAHQYREVLKIDPDHQQAKVALGYCYLSLPVPDYDGAEKLLLEAEKREKEELRIQIGLGFVYFQRALARRRAAAVDEQGAQAWEKSDPAKAASFAKAAKELRDGMQADQEAAEKRLQWCKEKDPSNRYVLQTLALTYVQMGPEHYPKAIEILEKYCEICAEVRAAALKEFKDRSARLSDRESGLYKSQIESLQLLERNARVLLGWMHYTLASREGADATRLRKADAELELSLKLDPSSAAQHLNRAHLLARAGRLPEAIEQLQQFLDKNQLGSPTLNLYVMRLMEEWKRPAGKKPPGEAGG